MKAINSVGCSIDGLTEKEFEQLRKNPNEKWMTEEEYFKLHLEEKE